MMREMTLGSPCDERGGGKHELCRYGGYIRGIGNTYSL